MPFSCNSTTTSLNSRETIPGNRRLFTSQTSTCENRPDRLDGFWCLFCCIFMPIRSMGLVEFTYIWLIFMVTVDTYASPMDPMGFVLLWRKRPTFCNSLSKRAPIAPWPLGWSFIIHENLKITRLKLLAHHTPPKTKTEPQEWRFGSDDFPFHFRLMTSGSTCGCFFWGE